MSPRYSRPIQNPGLYRTPPQLHISSAEEPRSSSETDGGGALPPRYSWAVQGDIPPRYSWAVQNPGSQRAAIDNRNSARQSSTAAAPSNAIGQLSRSHLNPMSHGSRRRPRSPTAPPADISLPGERSDGVEGKEFLGNLFPPNRSKEEPSAPTPDQLRKPEEVGYSVQ